VPRLAAVGSSYDESRLYDQTLAALRFAQKAAVSMQRTVCVAFSGGNTLTLTYDTTYGSASCPGTALPPPGGVGGGGAYTVVAQGAAGYSAASSFSISRIGRPSAGQTLSLAGGRQIVIEAETGYAR
jgi:MSHA pilin protein MshC